MTKKINLLKNLMPINRYHANIYEIKKNSFDEICNL